MSNYAVNGSGNQYVVQIERKQLLVHSNDASGRFSVEKCRCVGLAPTVFEMDRGPTFKPVSQHTLKSLMGNLLASQITPLVKN